MCVRVCVCTHARACVCTCVCARAPHPPTCVHVVRDSSDLDNGLKINKSCRVQCSTGEVWTIVSVQINYCENSLELTYYNFMVCDIINYVIMCVTSYIQIRSNDLCNNNIINNIIST